MRGLPVAFHRVRGERIACILGVLAGLSVLRHSPNQGRERTSGLFYFIFYLLGQCESFPRWDPCGNKRLRGRMFDLLQAA